MRPPTFYDTVTDSPQWKKWEHEQAKRFCKASHAKYSKGKFNGCYDMSEVMECGGISQAHFQDFIKFVKTNHA